MTVQADQNVTVSLQQPTKLKVIGVVTSRAASALVKPGTSADVYSINSVTQDKASPVGGGGNLNSAWSAITTVPGVYVAPNQAGYIGAAPSISIRGGDYNQIGYELDGVPVNRAFDNYPSGALSSLGQQELQVYTGAPSATAEANGISGYINQVIRTGSAPASRNLTLAIGAPALYNKGAFEAGGANPTRTFSYYLGAGTYSQAYRYYDQYNGASLQSVWGGPINLCPNATLIGCHGPQGQDYTNGGASPAYALGPFQYGAVAGVRDSDAIVNLHFGLPRKDGNRDDVQLLFDNNSINNISYTSTNDAGGAAFDTANGLGVPSYIDGYQFVGAPLGTVLPAGYHGGGVTPYLFPGSPGGRPMGAAIAPDRRDAFVNNQSVLKLQYQHNFGTSAFLRVYGYTYYSDWNQVGPQELYNNYLGFVPDDYELNSHTRGVSVQFSDQLNSQHLISVNGSYTTARTLRDNNTEQRNGIYGPNTFNFRTVAGLLVDSSNPYDGICYSAAGVAVNCYRSLTNPYGTPGGTNFNPAAAHFTLQQALNGTVVPASGVCGGGPCAYMLAGNGLYATYNTVRPKFSSFALTDQWKPTNRLNVDLGLRMDRFEFDGSDTTNSAARTFFFNAYNRQFGTTLQNVPNQVEAYNELQPRVGMTYTVNPATVLRLSYGRYAEAPNSAFEQYDYLQPNSPPSLAGFLPFGVGNTPGHAIRPQVANNYDFSYEHQFNRDTSMKLTPFYRKTQDQIQQFYLDQKTSFVSGLNVGRQTSQGVELEIDKGDFSRNGLAARLSFTYTNSYINYTRLASGQSIIDGFNTGIKAYNAYTSFCATNPDRCALRLDRQQRRLAVSRRRGRRGCAVLLRRRRAGSGVRGRQHREPVLECTGSGAARPEREVSDVRHLPGRDRRGRIQHLRRAVRLDAHRAVQARSARHHAGAPVLRRLAVRRAAVHAGDLSRLLHGRAPRFDGRRSTLQVRRTGRRTVRRHRLSRPGGRRDPQPRRGCVPRVPRSSEPVHARFRQPRGLRRAELAAAPHAGHVRRQQARDAGRELREHHQPLLGRNQRSPRR